ncbi:hypothetical protein L6R52_43975, partial [Myxococcota bacterium]|nr:hypothetical protein [Myxococcota bacterium]
GTTPRIRYREVADGTLLFSGRIEDARIAVPEASESWLDRGEFSFVARAEVGAEARRVITNGRVIPLDPERVRVTPVPPRGGGVDVDTEVVIVVDSGPDYDGSGGCEGDTVDDPDPTPDPWEPGPITSDPTDPTPTDPIPTDPTPDVEDPTTDPTDPPPSTGAPPTADDPSGGCDEGTSDASSGGCDEGTSGDGGGCDSAETESGGGCEASDGDGSGGCGGDTSSSGGGCEGDTSSSAGGCDCEGEAYAATAARGLDAAPAHRPARRPFDLERAVASVFRLAWPIVLAGLWNRRRRYFLARGLAVSDALDVRRDDDTTTTVPDKTS